MRLAYDNYIFDLYGTLLEIRTDEFDLGFWKEIAALYSAYGAEYEPAALRDLYSAAVHAEEQRIADRTGVQYPEVQLERIFAELFLDAPERHETHLALFDDPEKEKRFRQYLKGKEAGEDSHSGIYSKAGGEENPGPGSDTDETDGADHADQETEEIIELLAGSSFIRTFSDVFRTLSRQEMAVYPGTIEILQGIRAAGGKVFLLSNAQELFTIPELEVTGLMPCFDAVYISSVCGMKKPEKAFMGCLLTEQHLDPRRSVMIGNDYTADIGIALTWDMDSVFLNTDGLSDAESTLRRQHVLREHARESTREPVVIDSGRLADYFRGEG